jgi:lysyl-tRNA synthetase class 2
VIYSAADLEAVDSEVNDRLLRYLVASLLEVAPAYSEQNDPDVQRAMFEAQAGEEKQNIDQDFLLALEHGMPPAGGMGVGIDRLCILLTGAESIRDVILFPQLRQRGEVKIETVSPVALDKVFAAPKPTA